MFEFFEHTADLGLRIRAADLDALYREAAEGLFAIIVEEVPADTPQETLRFRISGARLDLVLLDWLNELLYTFETRGLLMREFEVASDDAGLTATARAQPIDTGRHRLLREVKAVTYHGLRVVRDGSGWLAEVIVDI